MTTTTLLPANTLQQSAAAAAAAVALSSSSGTSTAGSSTTASSAALQSLAGNFNDFLNLLTTQLQNQDPTSPMDTDSFTTELVQFTGVQEEVSTNSSLSQLIQLTQGDQLLQGSKMVGQSVTATSSEIALQNGSGEVQYQGTAGQPVAIAVVDAGGTTVRSATLTAQSGTNTWTWDGLDDQGNTVPDGAYRIGVESTDVTGNPIALPTSVVGTATGVAQQNGTMMLDIGALAVPMSTVTSLGGS